MKIYEIGTGYTAIPAKIGAATEIVVEELTKSFMKLGYDAEIIDIAAADRTLNNLIIREVKVPKILMRTDVHLGIVHKLKRVIYSVALAGELRKILKSSHERVVFHFHNQYNLYFFLKLVPLRLRKKALIAYTVHSYIWHGEWPMIEDTVKARYFQELHCIKNAGSVFVLNEQTRKNIIEHVGVEIGSTFLIDNGVNLETYCPLPESEREMLKQKASVDGKRVFIQVGSVCDRKNQLQAVKMLEPLMKKDPRLVYCYAGGVIDQEYQNSIAEFARVHGIEAQIRYVGEIAPGRELNEFYNLGDAMVFPSKAEGFSLVIIEAMAAGLPVIIHESLRFKLASECCRYNSENDFNSVVCNSVLEDSKRKYICERVRNAVENCYGWQKIAKDYYSVWRE